MASLQKKGGSWYCQFVHHKQRHTLTLGPVSEDEAHATKGRVEYLLMRLKQNLLTVPAGMDICTFLRHDGRPPKARPPSDDLIRSAAQRLTGHQRRLFQAEVANALCAGSARAAERGFGWGRDCVQTGLHEARTAIRCVEDFPARGARAAEDKDPNSPPTSAPSSSLAPVSFHSSLRSPCLASASAPPLFPARVLPRPGHHGTAAEASSSASTKGMPWMPSWLPSLRARGPGPLGCRCRRGRERRAEHRPALNKRASGQGDRTTRRITPAGFRPHR